MSRYLAREWIENIQATRECSRLTADVGDKVAVIVNLVNTGRLPIPWLLMEDALPKEALVQRPPRIRVDRRRVAITRLASAGQLSLPYQVTFLMRGYYQIGPLLVETGDLFGLHRRYRVLTKPTFLTVLPRTIPLEGYDIASRQPLGEVRMTHRLYEDPTRNAGVREYQPGDPLNRVHWGATARSGVLHSKIYEPSTVAGATIVLDFHTDSHPHNNEPMRSELAVTAAASLAHALYEMGQQVGLITNGRDAADRVRQEGWAYDLRTRDAARKSASMLNKSDRLRPQVLVPTRGPEQLQRLRKALARVELTDGLHFDALVSETACRMPRDATVIAILQEVTERYAVVLGNLRRQGYAVTAILNIHEMYDFTVASKHLLTEGITTHHLAEEAAISSIARSQFFGIGAA